MYRHQADVQGYMNYSPLAFEAISRTYRPVTHFPDWLQYNKEIVSDTVHLELIKIHIDPQKPVWYQYWH